jgi:four helix bundle protein
LHYRRFEELPAWNSAMDLAVKVFELTAAGGLRGFGGLRDQMERAAVSVSNNIAEGFERGTREELLSFLYIARGSAGEVRSMLSLLERLPVPPESAPQTDSLKSLSLSVSRQIGAWIESLKNSESKGPRFKNATARRVTQTTKRSKEFLDKLRQIQSEGPNTPSEENTADETPL